MKHCISPAVCCCASGAHSLMLSHPQWHSDLSTWLVLGVGSLYLQDHFVSSEEVQCPPVDDVILQWMMSSSSGYCHPPADNVGQELKDSQNSLQEIPLSGLVTWRSGFLSWAFIHYLDLIIRKLWCLCFEYSQLYLLTQDSRDCQNFWTKIFR